MTRARLGFLSVLMLLGCPAEDAGDDVNTDSSTDGLDPVEDDDDDGTTTGPSPTGTSTTSSTATSTQSSTSSDATTTDETGPTTSPMTTVTATSTTSDETTAADSSDSSTGEPVDQIPPEGAELLAWLQAGEYESWNAESGPHDSAGPHFGTVRTFMNNALFNSLTANNASHTQGASAVKELYGDSAQVRGWAVMTKIADGAGGSTWYWYEWYDSTTYADAVGLSGCTDCHGMGDDHVRSPFPLQ